MNSNMLLTDGASVQFFIHCYSECPNNSFLIINNIYTYPYILNTIHSQYQYPRGSTTLTTVMQLSWELHNIITYLHNIIHLTSIGDASSPPLVEWALSYDPQGRWWEWGNNSMYRRCLQLARWWLEYNPLWWKGRFRPTSAQCPQVGAFHVCFVFSFWIWTENSPSSKWVYE